MTTEFPVARAHTTFQTLFPDVFVVRSGYVINPLVRITRNMIVLREGRDLTLVNPVRLTTDGEAELEALGTVKHVVKLGHFHTIDEPYVAKRFAAKHWAPAPKSDDTTKLVTDGPSPVTRATVFSFDHCDVGEAALVVKQPEGNLLVTCDSVQNWTTTEGCSLAGGLVLRAMRFFEPAKIGPIWCKSTTGGKPSKLKPDFDRLNEREFAHLIAGHGTLLRDDARAAIARQAARVLVDR